MDYKEIQSKLAEIINFTDTTMKDISALAGVAYITVYQIRHDDNCLLADRTRKKTLARLERYIANK